MNEKEYREILKKARAVQAKQVMPLIGPLLDQWEGLSNDTKSVLREEGQNFCECLNKIEEAMGADISEASQESDCVTLPLRALREVFDLAQVNVMQMPTRNPHRRSEIARAFEDCRKAVAVAVSMWADKTREKS